MKFNFHFALQIIISLMMLTTLSSLSPQAQALDIKSSFFVDTDETVYKMIHYQCTQPEDSFCWQACPNGSCMTREPMCYNCAGSSNEVLKILFTRPSHFYFSTEIRGVGQTLLSQILNQKIVLIDSQSIYNFYTSIGKKESLPHLLKMCPHGSTNATLAVLIDESFQPVGPVAAICDTPQGQQTFWGVQERTRQQAESVSFMDDQPLQLKMSLELKLN